MRRVSSGVGMPRKDRIDAAGAAGLVGFSLLLAVNQVLIKLVNAGFSPSSLQDCARRWL